MTILATADLHFSTNPRDDYRHKFQSQLRALVKKHKVEAVLVLGDLTEEFDRHDAWLVNQVADHFHLLSSLCQVVILRGNHDFVQEEEPFFRFLQWIDGITWVQGPTPLSALPSSVRAAFESDFDTDSILFLPSTKNHIRDWADFNLADFEWVFTHNTFNEVYIGHGRTIKGIPLADLPEDGTNIISGDVHIPQELGPVTYVGAPYLVDFGDDYNPRVLLIDKMGMKSIPVTGPQKRLIEVDSLTALSKLKSLKSLNKGDILKIRIALKQGQRAEWPQIQEEARRWGEDNGYIVHVVQPILSADSRRMIGKRTAQASKTDEQLLHAYAKSSGTDDATTKVGVKLLKVQ